MRRGNFLHSCKLQPKKTPCFCRPYHRIPNHSNEDIHGRSGLRFFTKKRTDTIYPKIQQAPEPRPQAPHFVSSPQTFNGLTFVLMETQDDLRLMEQTLPSFEDKVFLFSFLPISTSRTVHDRSTDRAQ